MSSVLLFFCMLIFVCLYLFLPVKRKNESLDEKGEVIKIYEYELARLKQQYEKGFLANSEYESLLSDLDIKSAAAINKIKHKRFKYQSSKVPMIIIAVGLFISSAGYVYYYQNNGIMSWQSFNQSFDTQISEGVHDAKVVATFLKNHDAEQSINYCFAVQQKILQRFDANADALANVAMCHWSIGSEKLARQALHRGLNAEPKHVELNYLSAAFNYAKNGILTAEDVERLSHVVAVNPSHIKSLQLLAMNSLNQGNYKQAKFFFTRLQTLVSDDAALTASLNKLTAEIDYMINQQNTPQDVNVGVEKQMQKEIESEKATPTLDTSENSVQLLLNIQITSDVGRSLQGTQVVFVVVRSEAGKLLVAAKYTIKDIAKPLSVKITNNQKGMMSQGIMHHDEKLFVTARISKSGEPLKKSGDYTSSDVVVQLPQSKSHNIHIDSLVP